MANPNVCAYIYNLPGMGPERRSQKELKMAYQSPFPSFLLNNKHTFLRGPSPVGKSTLQNLKMHLFYIHTKFRGGHNFKVIFCFHDKR